jgi:hypothetical protein
MMVRVRNLSSQGTRFAANPATSVTLFREMRVEEAYDMELSFLRKKVSDRPLWFMAIVCATGTLDRTSPRCLGQCADPFTSPPPPSTSLGIGILTFGYDPQPFRYALLFSGYTPVLLEFTLRLSDTARSFVPCPSRR